MERDGGVCFFFFETLGMELSISVLFDVFLGIIIHCVICLGCSVILYQYF